jgi:tetratricopeptide (TPR) repeat protein
LSAQDAAPRAERAQFESVCATLRKESREFLKQIGGVEVLKASRAAVLPPRENWWWYLDEELAASQRQSLTHSLRTIGIAIIVFAIAAIVYQVFFAPDPKVIAEVDAQQNADFSLTEGKLQDALNEIDAGLQKVPDSSQLLLYKAVILREMGRTAEAEPYFTRAKQLFADPELFGLSEAQILNMMNKPQDAVNLLQDLIKQYPTSGRAYLLMGQAYEVMGNQKDALAAYEQASSVGEQSGDSTTTAQARIKMGMLMQVYGMPDFGPTPTVTNAP